MPQSAAEQVRSAIAQSSFLKSIAAAREAHLATNGYRTLRAEEIETLTRLHNCAADWAQVLVAPEFNARKVVGCYFSGPARLGVFKEQVEVEIGVSLGSGVYNCDLSGVTIGDHAYVANVNVLANAFIGARAVLSGCGAVLGRGGTNFGNGQALPIAIETGGRETAVYAELTIEIAARIAGDRKDRAGIEAYKAAVADYARAAKCGITIIESGARVLQTPKVLDVYAGPSAVIDGATWVENATLLSSPEEPTRIDGGAYVKDALLQWGSSVGTLGIVTGSVLCEHSHVERHGKLSHSILGPNSALGGGECTAALCGPFVGFHHQSLLIAALWPEGKGNISYGSNVGSNHTSKAPDQEIWCGEGTMFGLGVNVKYPSNFQRAPYTILASGISALPQAVEMPFSLINMPFERIGGVSPAFNEIYPGWQLSDNYYALRRNEVKYASRNKARRQRFEFELLRPEIIDLVGIARERLLQAAGQTLIRDDAGQPVYTEREVPGLGKNYLKEVPRRAGLEAYTFFIRYYALRGLKRVLGAGAASSKLLQTASADTRWEHERKLLAEEFPGADVRILLEELLEAQDRVAQAVQACKAKDDERGVRIIPDYAEAHVPAAQDPVVLDVLRETKTWRDEVEALLRKL